ncbi:hypothetical protein P7C71_g3682, partial [Lecanoromycetidae sp. Uapishka_2]
MEPLQPACPTQETSDKPNFYDWKTADGRQGALDSSTCYQMIEADMMSPSDQSLPPVLPPWARFKGQWSPAVINPYGPLFPSTLKWSPQPKVQLANIGIIANRIGLESFRTTIAHQQALIQAAANSVPLSKAGWTANADSFEPGYEPSNVLNNDNASIWHTRFSGSVPPLPHAISVDMQKMYLINGLIYLPRQDGGANGCIGQYSVAVSLDNRSWSSSIASGSWASDRTQKKIDFTPTLARYARLTATTEAQGQGYPWSSCASLTVLANLDPNARQAAEQALAAKNAAQAAAEAVAQAAAAKAAEQAEAARAAEEAATRRALEQAAIAKAAEQAAAAQASEHAAAAKAAEQAAAARAAEQAANAKAAEQAAAAKASAETAIAAMARQRALMETLSRPLPRNVSVQAMAQSLAKETALPKERSFVTVVDAAFYGPREVTQILENSLASWCAGLESYTRPFTFVPTNGNLGGDPQPNVPKTLNVLFRQWTFGASADTSRLRAVSVPEGVQLTFDTTSPFAQAQVDAEAQRRMATQAHVPGELAMTIIEAVYGGKDVKPLITAAYSRHEAEKGKLPWNLQVSNATMGGDPTPGKPKSAKVVVRVYKTVNVVGTSVLKTLDVAENGTLKFG